MAHSHIARTMVIVAHPDDDVIGATHTLAHTRDVRVTYVTDGAPRDGRDAAAHGFASWQAYADARAHEARAALALAGIPAEHVSSADIPDQGAAHALAPLARRLAAVVEAGAPAVVITHAYEGGHPDHDATAFAVHAAARLLARRGAPAPALRELTGYHAANGTFAPFTFLGDQRSVETIRLSPTDRALKDRMLACHASQASVLAAFPTELERERPAPTYDFTRPPHAGVPYYDRFDWGVSGETFCALARESLAALGLAGAI